jgi:hypothetical protein
MKFLFLFQGTNDSPDARAAWEAWFASIAGSLLDGGNPLEAGRLVTATGATELPAASDPITGYALVTAPDLAAAEALAVTCPATAGVRIYPALGM